MFFSNMVRNQNVLDLCIIFRMGTIEVKELCEHVWYTLLKDKEHIVSAYGGNLNYYIAGSFATHVHTGQYSFNDIDVFVKGSYPNELVDESKCYDIDSSYKLRLRKKDGSLWQKYFQCEDLKVNIIIVSGCNGLEHLINFFDVNSCQVGYEMDIRNGSMGKVAYTDFYKDFLQSRILKVVSFHTPASSFFRLINKSIELKLPRKMGAGLLMKLKWNIESKKTLNKGLFEKVNRILCTELGCNKFYAVMRNFDFNIIGPSEEEKNVDFYDNGEPGEYSASMSYLLKNGCGIEFFFHGNKDNDVHFSCINGDSDSFVRFSRLITVYGPYAAFEKDDLELTCIDYLLHNESPSAIDAHNFLISELVKFKYY